MTTLSVKEIKKPIPYKMSDNADYPHTVAESAITPELQAKIDEVMQEYREGKGVTLRTPKEIEAYIESL
ncbi:MAG: hypothetical protein IJR07_08400 [Bacteroidaceae bacterium]|nr:hypothetical protein [Bacteroidaceae bacterium]